MSEVLLDKLPKSIPQLFVREGVLVKLEAIAERDRDLDISPPPNTQDDATQTPKKPVKVTPVVETTLLSIE